MFHIFSIRDFDEIDYVTWNRCIEDTELAMQQFVKQQIQPIENVDAMLLLLKRFDRLQLDCLCMDHRYLDVFRLYQKELEQLKDS